MSRLSSRISRCMIKLVRICLMSFRCLSEAIGHKLLGIALMKLDSSLSSINPTGSQVHERLRTSRKLFKSAEVQSAEQTTLQRISEMILDLMLDPVLMFNQVPESSPFQSRAGRPTFLQDHTLVTQKTENNQAMYEIRPAKKAAPSG